MTSAQVDGAGRWRVTSSMTRRAGLPAAALQSLRSPDFVTWLEDAAAARRRLTAISTTLADRLYQRIGDVADDRTGLRPALVGLRRAAHQQRMPAARETAAAVRAALDEETCRILDDYLSELERSAILATRLDALAVRLDGELVAAVRETIAAPEFRHGLATASASLADEVDRWLRQPDRRPQRKKIIRLAKYIARAAAKTSPYSTFTTIGPVVWTPGRADHAASGTDNQPRSVIELNGEFADAVHAALRESPRGAGRLRLAVNQSVPTTVRSGDRILAIGRPPGERVVEVCCTPAVLATLKTVREYGSSGAEQVVAELAHRTGQAVNECRRFLDHLENLGVVYVQSPVGDRCRHPWRELSYWADQQGADELQSTVKLLGELADEIDATVPLDDLAGHVGRMSAISRIVDGLASELSIKTPVVQHETVVTTTQQRTLDVSWRVALDDVDLARRWLVLFDAALPVRLVTADWFGRTVGAGPISFPEFYQRFRRAAGPSGDPDLGKMIMAADQPFPAALEHFGSDRVRELARRRAEALALINLDHGRRHGGVVRLDPRRIADAVAAAPGWLRAPGSVGCYLQPVGEGDDLQLVINALHLGYGRATGRLDRLLTSAGFEPAEHDALPPSMAEFGSAFGSTMNHRDPTASNRIGYPYGNTDPAESMVAIGDLEVSLDAGSGTLQLSTTDGRALTPAHLGMSAEFVLPPAARLLERTFGRSLLLHPSAPPLSSADVTASGGRAFYPRVTIGRAIVQRARWCFDSADFPSRRAGERDIDFLVRLTGTLAEQGIGQRFFLRSWTGDRSAASKSRKPLYVDCASLALVSVMERALAGAKLVVIDEALPDPFDLVDRQDSRVEELFVELTDSDGRGGCDD